MRTTDSVLWKILKFFQLHKVYRMFKRSLPPSAVNIISNLTQKNVYMPLVYAEALEPKYEMAWKHLLSLGIKPGDQGDYLEFGVSRGTSMACMHRIVTSLQLDHVRLIGFDSFEGMPESAAVEDHGVWKPGEFASSLEQTRKFLDKANINWQRTHLIKGWFEDTLNPQTVETLKLRKAGVIMVDCDIYSAAKTALNFSLPLIKDNSIIFFDDWKDDITFGEYKAYSEFLNENKHLQSSEFGTYHPRGRIFLVHNTKGPL